MVFDYTMDSETLEAIHAAEILKEYCGNTKCTHCPFYDFRRCALINEDVLLPVGWEIPERK